MRNSSYSIMPILLKFHRCFVHGLKMCMWFGYNPQIILLLFLQIELSLFSCVVTIKVKRYWVPCVHNFSYKFMPMLLKLRGWFGQGLKMCMCFGFYPQITILTFVAN